MIRGFENNLDEMKAIDYLDSLDKRILMTREEGKLTQLIIDYKKIINKAIEYIEDNMSYVVKGNKEYIPAGEELLDILRGNNENE